MTQIQKVSSHFLNGFNVLLMGIPLLVAIQWVFIKTKTMDVGGFINFFGLLERVIETPEGPANLSTLQWTPFLKLLGMGADILGLLPFLLSLFVLKALFRNYQAGEIFSPINANHYKKLGWLFFLDALLVKSLSHSLMVLAVTLTYPPGHRYLVLSYGIPNLKALFCGVLVLVISWVMGEASKLHDEHRFTI